MSAPPGYSGKLLKDEQFNQGALDTSFWLPNMGTAQFGVWNNNGTGGLPSPLSGVGANGFMADFYDPANITVGSGSTAGAIITAFPDLTYQNLGYTWRSGCFRTQPNYFTGGFFQALAKQPDCSQGPWPAFWLPPESNIAEIDIQCGGQFGVDGVPQSAQNRSWNGQYFGSGGVEAQADTGIDLSATYNVYGLEYIPGSTLKFYFNGILMNTQSINQSGTPNLVVSLDLAQNAAGFHSNVSGSTPQPYFYIRQIQFYHL
jgi:hypothetical protein